MGRRVFALGLATMALFSPWFLPDPARAAGKRGHTITIPVWRPNAALVDQLGPEIQEGAFALRTPPDGALQQQDQGNIHQFIWIGQPRPDRTVFVFVLAFAPRTGTSSPAQVMSMIRGLLRMQTSRAVQTKPQHGSINGMVFTRVFFKATAPNGLKVHGFVYFTIFGNQVAYLVGQDFEPYNKDTLNLAETAVFTFHRM